MNDLAFDVRVADIAAMRRQARAWSYSGYFGILAVVLWSIHAIVIADTDWSRILNGSLLTTLGRFMEFDYKLIPDLLLLEDGTRRLSVACPLRSKTLHVPESTAIPSTCQTSSRVPLGEGSTTAYRPTASETLSITAPVDATTRLSQC